MPEAEHIHLPRPDGEATHALWRSEAGVRVLEFNPVNPAMARQEWELNERDHRKLLIVDGRTAFLGGINISSVYSGGSFSGASRERPDGTLERLATVPMPGSTMLPKAPLRVRRG